MDNKAVTDKKKNEYIELLRFVLCMMIFFHHSGHVTGGAVSLLPACGFAADVFYMITGYYAIRHICSRMGKIRATESAADPADTEITRRPLLYSVRYTLRKILRVYPYVVFGTVIIYILEFIVDNRLNTTVTAADRLMRLKDMLIELTFLPLTGAIGDLNAYNYRNAPMWYLSAMLIALPLVMYLCIRLGKVFRYVIVFVIPLALQILMMQLFGGVLPWSQFAGIINSGYIRAFSSLLMGGGIYVLSEYIKAEYSSYLTQSEGEDKQIDIVRFIATVAEVMLILAFLFFVAVGIKGYAQVAFLYVIAAMLTLTLSGLSYSSELRLRPAGFLGRLSLPIYCIHWGIYRWMAAFFGYLDYKVAIAVTLILCLAAAVAMMTVIDMINKRGRVNA